MLTSKSILAIFQGPNAEKLRYLIAGGWNTLFGYFFTIGIYYTFAEKLHIVFIGLIANVVCISMSFFTYKVFVFRTGGSWLREYFRCYLVYGANAIVGIAGLWLLVDIFKIPFWGAQAGLMIAGVVLSYLGHAKFTFKKDRQH